MATITFKPELCNPAKDKEVVLSFSDIVPKQHEPNTMDLVAGVNYKVNDALWAKAMLTDSIKGLISIGALREEVDQEFEGRVISVASTEKSLETVDLSKALDLIEGSHDITQLKQWLANEARLKVRNSLNKRIESIISGNA